MSVFTTDILKDIQMQIRQTCPMDQKAKKNDNHEKETEKEWKDFEHEVMKEESHQLELQSGYEQDESYEESKE